MLTLEEEHVIMHHIFLLSSFVTASVIVKKYIR